MSNGSSTGNGGTDWGELINDVGGLVDGLFDGSFWDFIAGLGCMSSDYKLRYLKDRFPNAINAMRNKSGVNISMTVENVNEFSKRLMHHYTDIKEAGASGCRGTYNDKYCEMLQTYINELNSLLLSSGFESSGSTQAINYNQNDLSNVNDGYGFQGNRTFQYNIYSQTNYGGGNYGTIGAPEYEPGNNPFGGGSYLPTMNNVNVMNYALGGLLLFGMYKYAKDNKIIK